MERESKLWLTLVFLGIVILIMAYSFTGGITGNVASQINEPVIIGVMVPLSGDYAQNGLSIQKGIEIAMREMDLDNLQIIYEDSRCSARDSVSAINKLISINKVQAIIGEVCSEATLAAGQIAEAAEVVVISPASTSSTITNAGNYIFRTVPSNILQGDVGAKLVYNRGYRKLALLYSNEDYSIEISNILKEKFQGQVVASEPFERGAADLRVQLTKIKDSNPDAIYFIDDHLGSTVAALKQIKELGISAAVFGSDRLKDQRIIDGAGGSAEGLILTSLNYGIPEFIAEYKRIYEKEPGQFAAQGYDAFKTITIAIRDGAKTGEEIKNRLYGIEFQGASGKIIFDANGDVNGNYKIVQVVQGNFVPLVAE